MILILFIILPIVLVIITTHLIRRYSGDDEIDKLIELNKAKRKIGMESIDWQKTNRAGERVWAKALHAQRKYSTQVSSKNESRRVN